MEHIKYILARKWGIETMKIIVTAVSSITSKKTNLHWNILHTVKVDTGEVKTFFLDDATFQKLGYKSDYLTDLKSGEIVHLEAQYDDRGNIVSLEE
jgi:hypothetical protein